MRYTLNCPNLKLKFDFDRPPLNDSLDELNDEELLEYIRDTIDENAGTDSLWEVVMNALSDFEPVAMGSFDLEEADAIIQKIALGNLEKSRDNSAIYITEKDEEGNVVDTKTLSYFSILVDLLEEEEASGEWYARVGKYIESNLRAFVENSIWHVGLMDESGAIIEDISDWPEPEEGQGKCFWGEEIHPIIWFGISGESPDPHWIYWEQGTDELSDLWYTVFRWETMECLVTNVNDAFLTWYSAECDFFTPEIEKILNRCPVVCNCENSEKDENTVFEEFFYQQWKAAQESEFLDQEIAEGMLQGFYQ